MRQFRETFESNELSSSSSSTSSPTSHHQIVQNHQLAQLLLGSSSATDPLSAAAAAASLTQTEVGSPLRKSFPSSPFASVGAGGVGGGANHQLTLGTINQQLNALTQQLSGLNQQTQNLQNLQLQGNTGAGHILAGLNANAVAASAFNSNKINSDLLSQHDLFQLNQDLLARLQQLNLNQSAMNNNNNNNNLPGGGCGSSSNSAPNSASPSSFIFTNPMNVGRPFSAGNANNNLLLVGGGSSDAGGGSLSPSPLSGGTLNRNSFSASPLQLDNYEHLAGNYDQAMQLHSDANNNTSGGGAEGLIRPISQVGTLTTVDASGKLKVIVPVKSPSPVSLASGGGGGTGNVTPTNLGDGQPFQLTPVLKRPEKKVTLSSATPSCSSGGGGAQTGVLRSDSNRSNPNMVTLKITDEQGHSHSPKRSSQMQPLSATPSFITRSTSEKVPNRSQMMQQVHRTTWARHTTK